MAQILSSIDIGSNSIVCLSSTVNSDGKLCLKAASIQESRGIKGGNIVDVKLATESILKAIVKSEKMLKKNIDTLIVGLSGELIRSKIITSSASFHSKKITKRDIFLLAEPLIDNLKNAKKTPIHIFPLLSQINRDIVDNPIGMVANDISTNFYTMYVDSAKINNIKNCFKKIDLKIDNFVFDAYAAAVGVLSEQEKTIGSLVINIGANTTSFVVVKDNKLVYGNSIQLAGEIITKDIADVLRVPYDIAEEIKIKNANFYADENEGNELIKIDINNYENNFRVLSSTTINTVNDIVKARISDILDVIFSIIHKKCPNSNFYNIVLTGGTANIIGIADYVSKITGGIKTRVGYVTDFFATSYIDKKEISNPSYATAFGLLSFVHLFYKNNKIEEYNNSGFFNRIFSFLSNLFIS